MAGGDLHIRVGASYGAGGLRQVVDASSTSNADLNLTSPMTVDGRQVFVTPEAKAFLDAQYGSPALGTSIRMTVHDDVRSERCGFLWLNKRQVNNIPDRNDAPGVKMPEEYLGTPKQ